MLLITLSKEMIFFCAHALLDMLDELTVGSSFPFQPGCHAGSSGYRERPCGGEPRVPSEASDCLLW